MANLKFTGRFLSFGLPAKTGCGIFAAALAFAALITRPCAADWPTLGHDNARSGATDESIALPLAPAWTHAPASPPKPAWPADTNALVKVNLDFANHVVAAGGMVYYGSSADNKVYALDAASGAVKWTFYADGPIRMAPALSGGRLYFGSDDGYAYCLNAATGAQNWKLRGGPGDRRILGNGRLMSVWPIRSGVLVDGADAYFCAGLFPTESIFICAVRAEDGGVIWKNDTSGQMYMQLPHGGTEGFSGITPEGALLASDSRLYIPNGRNVPAAFDRRTGKFAFWQSTSRSGGGACALVCDDILYSGPDGLQGFKSDSGDYFATFPGNRLVVTRDSSIMQSPGSIMMVDRRSYAEKLRPNERKRKEMEGIVRNIRDLSSRRQELAKDKAKAEDVKMIDAQIKDLIAKQKAVTAEVEATAQELRKCVKWQAQTKCGDSMILAGGTIFAGGDGEVVALAASNGSQVWEASIEGKALGLAVSEGKLYVSSDNGKIFAFAGGAPGTGASAGAERPKSEPFPKDALSIVYDRAAESILAQTGITKGYCLVLGSREGRLAYEIAQRTKLNVYCVEPNAEKVKVSRAALDAAGLYGTRVTVDCRLLGRLPYPEYFANLIVSEELLVNGTISADAQDAFRMLKPCGGAICLVRPTEAEGVCKPLDSDALSTWIRATDSENYEISLGKDCVATIRRGPLPGAGEWTHQYADAGNTGCSDEELVEFPLGVLWFGDSGPQRVIDRHSHPPAPLSAGGRMFIPANDRVIAIDPYNGTELWDAPMPGSRRTNMSRDLGNMVASRDSVFRAAGDSCIRLNSATGVCEKVYKVPDAKDGKPRDWGYLACAGDVLIGGATARDSAFTRAVGNFYEGTTQPAVCDDSLFSVGIEDGQIRWAYSGGIFSHIATAIGDGRIFMAESRGAGAMKAGPGQRGAELLESRFLVALDLQTGKKLWEKELALKHFGTGLFLYYRDGVLAMWGVTDKSYLAAFSAADGEKLWERPYAPGDGYWCFRHPVIVGETIYAEPAAFDLRTGAPRMRKHALSGQDTEWNFRRAYACGTISACENAIFYRSGCFGIYDLDADAGTTNWGGMRPGCWINIIPAAGLVLAPEGSAFCTCAYPIQTSIAFTHVERNENWSVYAANGPAFPVKRIGLNLGAPGDRRDDAGTLWLSAPRPQKGMAIPFEAKIELTEGGSYFLYNSDSEPFAGAERSWIFASGCRGISNFSIPLTEEGKVATYTVRLMFADPESAPAGSSIFDVMVQGRTALENFDPAVPGGPCAQEIKGVKVSGRLTIEFIKKSGDGKPILNGVEIIREDG
ncbi:MAG TPA: PQQ-binding-like beta-propeller repeat protein [Candidatus Brocadiia bacterium]|nr:PQQ-binding-like beta-propeller repeat protein [Candidatus Brocadiia bacterium]